MSDPEDANWWPPLPNERDEHGELVESLPETAELVGFWPADKGEDCR